MRQGFSQEFFLFNLEGVVFGTEMAKTKLGEFPIMDTWHPLFLEIPEGGSKGDMRGRFIGSFSSPTSAVEWDKSRIVNLPAYKDTQRCQQEMLKSTKVSKEFPNVPVITLAIRYDGCYCEQRRAQAVSVLPVWLDDTSVLLELDWCEGPIEDCSNAEWHLRASTRLPIRDGLDELRKSCRNPPIWENCCFSLYIIPPFLGSHLLGAGKRISSKVWQREWKYTQHGQVMAALNQIMATIWG